MPENKKAGFRYALIEEALKKNDRMSAEQLSDYVNDRLAEIEDEFKPNMQVTKRTIYNDIRDIQSLYKIEILNQRGKFSYADLSDSIHKVNLNKEEKTLLEMALQTFSIYQGTEFFQKFDEVISKVLAGKVMRGLHRNDPSEYIQISNLPENTGQQWIVDVYNAVIERRTLEVLYHPYGGDAKVRTICPYLLKEFKKNWYLIGYAYEIGENGMTNIFKLSRIMSIKKSSKKYYDDPKFQKDDYFTYSLGVVQKHGEKPVDVVLKFSKDVKRLILENKIHHSMEIIEETTDYLKVSIKVFDSVELRNLIFSFASNVEVISPKSLRDDVKKEIAKMKAQYVTK